MKKRGKDQGDMTVREMAVLGGLARGAKCPPEELSRIGRLGIAAMLAKYSREERVNFLLHGGRLRTPLTKKKIARIKKLFKSGWTQTQIAEALDVSRPTVGRHLQRKNRRRRLNAPAQLDTTRLP
jgi:DNA invertase Pin-like site-specific DNA recombinase